MVKPIPDGFHSATICLTVKDSVAAIEFYKKALDAHELFRMPGPDRFWGDRIGGFEDPSGHRWTVATHTKDLTPDEMAKAAQEAMKAMCTE